MRIGRQFFAQPIDPSSLLPLRGTSHRNATDILSHAACAHEKRISGSDWKSPNRSDREFPDSRTSLVVESADTQRERYGDAQ
jgi:hypothetical protein